MIIKQSFETPLYRGRFIVMFSDYQVKISDHYDDLGYDKTIEYASFVLVNETLESKVYGGYLIGFNIKYEHREITNGVIGHEVLHAAHALLKDRGLKLTDDSDEAYAYLVEWMTDKVYEVMEINNIKL
jgi:hypothetical protein